MDELLTDQQQAERVKVWLKENGGFILGGLALGLAGLFGWNQWQSYRTTVAEQASAVYEEFMEAMRQDRMGKAQEFLGDLESDHSGSPYLDQARLALARAYMDRNEADEAATSLERIVAASSSREMQQIARLRLARVRLQQQQYEAALDALTNVAAESAFGPRSHEVRGDIYFAMGRRDEARAEYQAALDAGQAGAIDRVFVQAKMDDLGAADKPPEDAPAAVTPAAEPVTE